MKRITIIVSILSIGFIYLFFHKTYLDFKIACTVNTNDHFYPDAYTFIHSQEEFNRYAGINAETKLLADRCGQSLNFNEHSYVIFYGRKPKKMYYSYKTSLFDDKSDSYARPSGKKVVFIEYDNANEGNGTFIYELEKNESLRGFYGA